MTYCYLDTETTGLDLVAHDVWEIAYAFDDEDIRSAIVAHHNGTADPKALEVNHYNEREIDPKHADQRFEDELRARLVAEKPTLVGSNPSFDAYRLSERWGGITPWQYRMLDVSVYAMPAMRTGRPPGLAAVVEWLTDVQGFAIPLPDHSASADVEATRAAHKALMHFYGTGWAGL